MLASPEVNDDCDDDDGAEEEKGETPTGEGERGVVYLEVTCVTLVRIAW